jgi:hypothetical protein
MEQTGFITAKKIFSMVCRIDIDIHAGAAVIWAILTDAKGFPRWNSTVNGIDGQIREGERIRIRVPGTNRTFEPRISDVVVNERMTWSNGLELIFKGSRSFQLKPAENGITRFIMEEKFSGLIFAIVKGMLPEFRTIFEAYARDLKRESERVAQIFTGAPLQSVPEH